MCLESCDWFATSHIDMSFCISHCDLKCVRLQILFGCSHDEHDVCVLAIQCVLLSRGSHDEHDVCVSDSVRAVKYIYL